MALKDSLLTHAARSGIAQANFGATELAAVTGVQIPGGAKNYDLVAEFNCSSVSAAGGAGNFVLAVYSSATLGGTYTKIAQTTVAVAVAATGATYRVAFSSPDGNEYFKAIPDSATTTTGLITYTASYVNTNP